MTREAIELQLRTENETTTDDAGERHGPGSEVYEAAIQRWADAMEAQAAEMDRAAVREALALQWAALPSWIRGPFGARYETAVRFLDAGDDDAAADLIRYAGAPAAYSPEQVDAFELIRLELLAAIEAL